MKNIFSHVSLVGAALCSALLLFACSKDTGDKDKVGTSCFEKFDYRYEDMLTKADVAKHVTIDEPSFKMNISSTKGEYGDCSYEWRSDRPDLELEISGQILKAPDRNRVKLTRLTFYTDSELKLYSQESALSLFNQSYKKLSQSEYDELLANMKKEFGENTTRFKEAKGFLDTRMKFTYQPVENLGTQAYWKWDDRYGIELVVLLGSAHFRVETKVTDKANSTLEAAVKFAREVLAKCGS